MGQSTWTGPIKAGSIPVTGVDGILGKDLKNVGFALMSQVADITQAGIVTAVTTGIVIPKNSTIVQIKLFSTVAFSGVATTISLGTSVAANELVAAGLTNGAVGVVDLTPGAVLAKVQAWQNVGTTDIAIWALAANTGAGVARLIVNYIQSNN